MSWERCDLPNGYGMVSNVEEEDPFLGIKLSIETERRNTAIFIGPRVYVFERATGRFKGTDIDETRLACPRSFAGAAHAGHSIRRRSKGRSGITTWKIIGM